MSLSPDIPAESKLSQLAMASLVYPTEGLSEPFHCLPTSSLVIQVHLTCGGVSCLSVHAPSLSVQEMLFNAVICELIQRQGIVKQTFLNNHPGGKIGSK